MSIQTEKLKKSQQREPVDSTEFGPRPSKKNGDFLSDHHLTDALGNEALLQLLGSSFENAHSNVKGQPPLLLDETNEKEAMNIRNVQYHPDSQLAEEMDALAFTQGSDIHFAPGQFNPNTPAGIELIAHELGHVIQQRREQVPKTDRVAGVPINSDPLLESQADALGKQAMQSGMVNRSVSQSSQIRRGSGAAVIQLQRRRWPIQRRLGIDPEHPGWMGMSHEVRVFRSGTGSRAVTQRFPQGSETSISVIRGTSGYIQIHASGIVNDAIGLAPPPYRFYIYKVWRYTFSADGLLDLSEADDRGGDQIDRTESHRTQLSFRPWTSGNRISLTTILETTGFTETGAIGRRTGRTETDTEGTTDTHTDSSEWHTEGTFEGSGEGSGEAGAESEGGQVREGGGIRVGGSIRAGYRSSESDSHSETTGRSTSTTDEDTQQDAVSRVHPGLHLEIPMRVTVGVSEPARVSERQVSGQRPLSAVAFDRGSHVIRNPMGVLNGLVSRLSPDHLSALQSRRSCIRIEGFADRPGTRRDRPGEPVRNLRISMRRAEAVEALLLNHPRSPFHGFLTQTRGFGTTATRIEGVDPENVAAYIFVIPRESRDD